jgi:hypothetical protein
LQVWPCPSISNNRSADFKGCSRGDSRRVAARATVRLGPGSFRECACTWRFVRVIAQSQLRVEPDDAPALPPGRDASQGRLPAPARRRAFSKCRRTPTTARMTRACNRDSADASAPAATMIGQLPRKP